MYAIITAWDAQLKVTRYNYVETEDEAKAIIDRVHGVGDDPLPPEKQVANAYYVLMPPAPAGTKAFQHRARFWKAVPGTQTMTFDTAACHDWQSKFTAHRIDNEADRRVDKACSPDNPSRADRVRQEMPAGAAMVALNTRVAAVRVAATTLKDSFGDMTPEEILTVMPSDDQHWPE